MKSIFALVCLRTISLFIDKDCNVGLERRRLISVGHWDCYQNTGIKSKIYISSKISTINTDISNILYYIMYRLWFYESFYNKLIYTKLISHLLTDTLYNKHFYKYKDKHKGTYNFHI